jgi:hypothetical protein
MRALFVGGMVDNSELDVDPGELPKHYPTDGVGQDRRYHLYEVGKVDGEPVYAVYASAGMAGDEVERLIAEREYPRRFGVDGGGERVSMQ